MRQVILLILDGWGYSKQKLGNAILNAKTPNIDQIQANYPMLLLQASGPTVGLLWGESGNSEVGHLTIGAGRTVFQYLSRIHKAIENGGFFDNPAFLEAISHVQKNSSSLHLVGLLGSNSVHSHLDHLFALIELAKRNNINDINIHLFTDGKDSGLKEAPLLLKKVEDYIKTEGLGKIATIIGRDIAMDRNKNWDLTEKTYNLLVNGAGERVEDIYGKLKENYEKGFNDINMPAMITDPVRTIKENDVIIFFNFREDRMKQLSAAFTERDFADFPRQLPLGIFVVGMTQFIANPNLHVAFPMVEVKNCLGEVLSKAGKKQLRLAETEKYAHITYFFNCLREEPFENETDILIKSDRNPVDNPRMKTDEITDKFLEEFKKDRSEFILINFANPDILSHFGNLEKVIAGIETVDENIEKIKNAAEEKGATLIITSDHGNAEALTSKSTGEAETKHNSSPVPIYFVAKEFERPRTAEELAYSIGEPRGFLSDIAPTILKLMDIEKPAEMTGENLLQIINFK